MSGKVLGALVFFSIAMSHNFALGQDLKYGTYGLFPQGSSRAMGMGGAYTALSDDVTGMIYNPAGVALGDWKYDIGGTQNEVDNREFDYFGTGSGFGLPYSFIFYAAAMRLGSWAVGVGASAPYNLDLEETISSFPVTKRIRRLQVTSLDVLLAKSFNRRWSVGVTGHFETVNQQYTDEQFGDDEKVKAKGSYYTYGIAYRSNKVGIGFSISTRREYEVDKTPNNNLTSSIIWFRDVAMPGKKSFGFYHQVKDDLLLVVDIDKIEGLEDTILPGSGESGDFSAEEIINREQTILHGGIEWKLVKGSNNEVLWRLGTYKEPPRITSNSERNHFTMGIEVRLGPAVLNMAFDSASDFKNNAAGFSLSFGKI